ncbi:hypothetical protein TWF696_003251 [Orbilia brochopaga]|uniref:Calcineurin-like phosphoesterase domain-containing protein n=1 Tax=Orbilia brochopaga TaxID=3140254 RepID=A0AAV9TY95_9PEZI
MPTLCTWLCPSRHRPPPTISIPLQHVHSNVMSTLRTDAQPARMTRKTRFVCIADTHNLSPYDGGFKVPKGDVLIHAGDMTKQGAYVEVQRTVQWIGRLVEDGVVEHAIIVAGNHDLTLDPAFYAAHGHNFHSSTDLPTDSLSLMSPPLLPPGITFLNHTSAHIKLTSPNGPRTQFSVFGSPYTPVHVAKVDENTTTPRWAFQYPPYPSTESEETWSDLPANTDVLITHGPPSTHLDGAAVRVGKGLAATSAGCEALRQACWRVRPSLHVFGHVHEGRGVERVKWQDGRHVIGMEEGCACFQSDGNDSESISLDTGDWTTTSDTTEPSLKKCCTHDHAQMEWRDPGAVDDRIAGKMSIVDVTARTRMFGGAGLRDGETLMVNAAIRRGKWPYKGVNKAIVVDIDLPVCEDE